MRQTTPCSIFWPSSVKSAVKEICPAAPLPPDDFCPDIERGTIVVLGGTCTAGGLGGALPSRFADGAVCACQAGAACCAAPCEPARVEAKTPASTATAQRRPAEGLGRSLRLGIALPHLARRALPVPGAGNGSPV